MNFYKFMLIALYFFDLAPAFSATTEILHSPLKANSEIVISENREMLADSLGSLYWDTLANHQNYGSPITTRHLKNTYDNAQKVIANLQNDSTKYFLVIRDLESLSLLLRDPFEVPYKKFFTSVRTLERCLAELYRIERLVDSIDWTKVKDHLNAAKKSVLSSGDSNELFFAGASLQSARAHIVGGHQEALSSLDEAIAQARIQDGDDEHVSPIRLDGIAKKLDHVSEVLTLNP